MDFKNLRKILIWGIIVLLPTFNCVAQVKTCHIVRFPVKPFYFNEVGKITKQYDQLAQLDSMNYQIMFINFETFMSGEATSYYISINPKGSFKVSITKKDSTIFSGCINDSKKYDIDYIKKPTINGFFVSECNNNVSFHSKQVLVICNKSSNTWIEFADLYGSMDNTLLNNPQYLYLTRVYSFVKNVFFDLNFSIDNY